MTTTPETPALPGDLTDETIERGARALAGLEPGEDWPTNEQLGGGPTGTRDDEYRDSMREQASAVLAAARVAPAQCGEPHPFMEGVCILPAGHEPGHECAPVTPSEWPPQDSCVFCSKIAADALWTDSERGVVSFTPLGPVTLGHRLFVPIEHVQDAATAADVTGCAFASAAEWAAEHGWRSST